MGDDQQDRSSRAAPDPDPRLVGEYICLWVITFALGGSAVALLIMAIATAVPEAEQLLGDSLWLFAEGVPLFVSVGSAAIAFVWLRSRIGARIVAHNVSSPTASAGPHEGDAVDGDAGDEPAPPVSPEPARSIPKKPGTVEQSVVAMNTVVAVLGGLCLIGVPLCLIYGSEQLATAPVQVRRIVGFAVLAAIAGVALRGLLIIRPLR